MEIENKVNVKWGKKQLEVVIDFKETLETLKATIYSMTEVLPKNQKLIYKGKFLKKNEEILENFNFKNNCKIILMGKPETKTIDLQKAQEINKNVFQEDLTPEQRAKYLKEVLGESLPVGLINLGNTCYMNSCMQILFKIKELREYLEKYQTTSSDQQSQLVLKTRDLFKDFQGKGKSFEPKEFLKQVFIMFPNFAERDPQSNSYRQQDADEFFQLFITSIGPVMQDKGVGLMEDLFQFKLKISFQNKEKEDEKGEDRVERQNKISCIIDNQNDPINSLQQGIKVGLEEEVEKFSDSLNKNCLWSKTSKIITLPKYLVVQKIRFIWREKDIGTNTEARKAKIKRSVPFPKILDLYDFCDDDLKKELDVPRKEISDMKQKQKLDYQKQFEEYKKKKEGEEDSYFIYKEFKQKMGETEQKNENEDLWREFGEGKDSGNYQLVGVITHKGRSTDSGHYVGWCQDKGDDWLKFDDDLVSKVKISDILELKGGGDWHMAYYLIYRKLQFKSQLNQCYL